MNDQSATDIRELIEMGKLTKAAKTLGSAGGKKGGPARAAKLSKAQRTAIAKQGGKARQGKSSQ